MYTAKPAVEVGILVLDSSILLACNLVAEVATLRCEVRVFAQVLDSAKQVLKLSVRSSGCVLRDLLD